MAKYLVTGGAGFIGSHIATALVERGDEVRVLDNFSTGHLRNLEHLGDRVEVIDANLLEAEKIVAAVEDVDTIFHQAALASVPRSVVAPLDTNAACVTGTLMLLDAARQAGVRRLVYAASSSAYGDQPKPSKAETDLPSPLSPYAAAKLAGEHYCHSFYSTYGFETVCIRYFNVFGPRQDPASEYSAVIPIFATLMLAGKSPVVHGDGSQSRDFTYIDNVVQGNLLAAESKDAVGRSINVACGSQTSLLDLIGSINNILGTNIEPTFDAARAGDVKESLADISLAQDVLGYSPVIEFEDGLRRSIEFYRSLM